MRVAKPTEVSQITYVGLEKNADAAEDENEQKESSSSEEKSQHTEDSMSDYMGNTSEENKPTKKEME